VICVALGAAGVGAGVMTRPQPAGVTAGQVRAAMPAEGQDAGKRPRSAEETLDQVRKLLAPDAPAVDPKGLDKLIDLLTAAKDTLERSLQTKQQAYLDFRMKMPHLLLRTQGGNSNIYMDHVQKTEAKLLELRQRRSEIEAQADMIERALAEKDSAAAERKAKAMLLLLQRRGVDVAAMRRAASDGRGDIKATDLLGLYADSLRAEQEELNLLVTATERDRDQAAKLVRDLNSYFAEDEAHRQDIKSTRDMFETIIKRIQEVNLLAHGPKSVPQVPI
jgi:hypothetical protein